MKKVFFTVMVCLFILGVSLTIVGYKANDELGFFSTIGTSLLSSTIIASTMELYIDEYSRKKQQSQHELLLKEVSKLVLNQDLLISATNIGLVEIHESRVWLYNNMDSILASAKKTIKIMGESLQGIIDVPENNEQIIRQIKNRVNIQIALMHPHCEASLLRFKELNLSQKESMGSHKKALISYSQYISNNNYKLKLFSNHPKLFIVIIDDEKVFAQHYSYGYGGVEAPLYVFKGVDCKTVLLYTRIFNNVWNHAENYDKSVLEETTGKSSSI